MAVLQAEGPASFPQEPNAPPPPYWGKGQVLVGAAVHHVRERLPIALRGLDSDNSSEFINRILYEYCQRMGITFTRSRASKNDSAHVVGRMWITCWRLAGFRMAAIGSAPVMRPAVSGALAWTGWKARIPASGEEKDPRFSPHGARKFTCRKGATIIYSNTCTREE